MSSFELRPIDPRGPHVRPFVELARLAFKDNAPITDEAIEHRRVWYAQQRVTGAFDGDQLVGTFRTWPVGLTVPGEPLRTVPATAVSTVAVLPTHTRRGILTALMRDHLDAAAAAGSAVAVLIASEAVIYGRYGFAPTTESTAIEVDFGRARMRPEVPDPGGVAYVTPEELFELAPAVHEAARRPGAIDRGSWWWEVFLAPDGPAGGKGRRVDLVRRDEDGRPDGYLIYRYTEEWEHRVPKVRIDVVELMAATPAAYAALWRSLFAVDTVATVHADPRPLDEALAWMLVDPRALHRKERSDFLWTRLLDPAAFFSTRGYDRGAAGRVVLEIDDPLGYAAGRFELSVDGAGHGECRPAPEASAQVRTPVDVLSAASLGGGDLLAAQAAGRIAESSDGAVRQLSALLRCGVAPFDGTWF